MDVNIPGYTIIREIRKGGMATVYLAIQHNLERQIALKIMSPQLADDPTFAERFVREAKITASMNHHNIVPVYDVGHFMDYHYLSMEYLPNGDFKGRLRDGVEPEFGWRVIYQIVDALNYVHARSYIHRDIKPENILFRADGTAVLTDFGIAKLVDAVQINATSSGTLVGSPRYMSPEQARAAKTDARTDIYSLGAVIYEILAGKQLYSAESPIAVAIKHINDPVPAVPARFSHLQPMLEKMLAKDPADRYQNMAEVAQALEQHVAVSGQQKKEMELLAPLQRIAGVRHLQLRHFKKQPSAVVSLVARGLTPLQNEKTLVASALTLIASPTALQLDSQPNLVPIPTPQDLELQSVPTHDLIPVAQASDPHERNQPRHSTGTAILSAGFILVFAVLASPHQPSLISFTPPSAPLTHASYGSVETANTNPAWTEPLHISAPIPIPKAEPISAAEITAPAALSVQPELSASAHRITELLTQADTALQELRLMQPVQANAYEILLEVLTMDPENQAASEGIRSIVTKYLELTDIALTKGSPTKAQQYVDRARNIVTWHHLDEGLLQQIDDSQIRVVTTYLSTIDRALKNENPEKAFKLLGQAKTLVRQHQLNAQFDQPIRVRQTSVERQRYIVAQKDLNRWNSLMQQNPDALNAEGLSQAYSAYMYMLRYFPRDPTIRSANAHFADAFFKVGKKHFKSRDMDTSAKLIAMGLKIDPQDKKLNDLKSRWDRRKQGKEYLLDRFY
ncbi:MAG TPA: serine/threonine-protein kinase [Dongiaceae bacterium]|nr:serine/threonine-protein kinase [Dongiaceae bacterium]